MKNLISYLKAGCAGLQIIAAVSICLIAMTGLAGCAGRVRTSASSLGQVKVGENAPAKGDTPQAGSNIKGERADLDEDEFVGNESVRAWRIALKHSKQGDLSDSEWKKVQEEDETEAMKILHGLAKDHPRMSYVHTMMGQVAQHFGKKEEASEHYERALLQNTQNPILLLKLANSKRDVGKLDKAIKYYREALNADPDFTDAKISLGATLLQKDKKDKEGRKLLEDVLSKDPENKEAKSALTSAQ